MKASDKISSRTVACADPAARIGNADSSSSTAKRFALSGPSLSLDPRVHAYRKDIADIALAGQLIAPHYARPVTRLLLQGCSLRPEGAEGSAAIVDMAAGEEFAVLEIAGGWAWGYRRKDHAVGFLPASCLELPPAE